MTRAEGDAGCGLAAAGAEVPGEVGTGIGVNVASANAGPDAPNVEKAIAATTAKLVAKPRAARTSNMGVLRWWRLSPLVGTNASLWEAGCHGKDGGRMAEANGFRTVSK